MTNKEPRNPNLTIPFSIARLWTPEAEIGAVLIFEEDEKGEFVDVIAMATEDTEEAIFEALDKVENYKNPTDRLIVQG